MTLSLLVACNNTSQLPANDESSSKTPTQEATQKKQSDTLRVQRLEKEFESFTQFAIWSKGQSKTEIAKELAKYGMKYKSFKEGQEVGEDPIPPLTAQNLSSCPERHWELAGTYVDFGSATYYIDASGRPLRAVRNLPFSGNGTRSLYCQGRVCQVYSENDTGYYDGGHLIGNQLGGWGYRINLAPQNYYFNRGNWLQIENAARACNALPPEDEGRFWYETSLEYPNSETNVPDEWDLLVTYENRPNWWETWEPNYEQEDADFTNTPGGGWNGDDERRQITVFLAVRGCTS